MKPVPLLLVAAALALAACGSRPEAVPPAPVPAPAPEPAPAAATEAPPAETVASQRLYPAQCVAEEGCVRVCVVKDGRLAEVPVLVDPRTGDSTYVDQPFATAFPTDSTYLANRTWYFHNEPIMPVGERIPRARYLKYGVPRVLAIRDLEPAGVYAGVPFFAEAGWSGIHDVLYFPVRPGCEFHPFTATGQR